MPIIMKKLITILFVVALGLNLSAQNECENPDLNCDGFVNVNDLLGILSYFGDEEDGQWLEGDVCDWYAVLCNDEGRVTSFLFGRLSRYICARFNI